MEYKKFSRQSTKPNSNRNFFFFNFLQNPYQEFIQYKESKTENENFTKQTRLEAQISKAKTNACDSSNPHSGIRISSIPTQQLLRFLQSQSSMHRRSSNKKTRTVITRIQKGSCGHWVQRLCCACICP